MIALLTLAATSALSQAGDQIRSVEQQILAPAGPAASRIASLGWFVLLTFSAVSVVMWVLIWWVATRRQGTLAEHAPAEARGGEGWIYIGGLAIPTTILALMFVLTLQAMAAFPMHDHDGMPDVRVVGHQWWWEVQYLRTDAGPVVTTANEVHVPVGHPVTIELISRDVIHSFWIPELHGKVDLIPGVVNYIRIAADRPGPFYGECAEYCGAEHAKMRLIVVADSPAEYASWIEGERSASAPPVTEQAIRGQDVFLSQPCVGCHTIRGTAAHGLVGPDLTHLASRSGLAANSLANDDGNLAFWVAHAQSVKPASQMPDLPDLRGADLQDLVAYLRTLR